MPQQFHAGDAILGFCFAWVFKVLYITGLTLLVPAVLVFLLPGELSGLAFAGSPSLFVTAAVLVAVSVFGLHAHYRSARSTCLHLGISTLIPGVIAIVFAFVQREVVFALAESYIAGFVQLEPLMDSYIERAVPKVIALAVAFVILGLLLVLVSRRLPRQR